MATSKDIKKILKQLILNGCQIEKGKTNHYKIYQNGIYKMTIGSTPSDFRAIYKIKAQIKNLIYGGIRYDNQSKLRST